MKYCLQNTMKKTSKLLKLYIKEFLISQRKIQSTLEYILKELEFFAIKKMVLN